MQKNGVIKWLVIAISTSILFAIGIPIQEELITQKAINCLQTGESVEVNTTRCCPGYSPVFSTAGLQCQQVQIKIKDKPLKVKLRESRLAPKLEWKGSQKASYVIYKGTSVDQLAISAILSKKYIFNIEGEKVNKDKFKNKFLYTDYLFDIDNSNISSDTIYYQVELIDQKKNISALSPAISVSASENQFSLSVSKESPAGLRDLIIHLENIDFIVDALKKTPKYEQGLKKIRKEYKALNELDNTNIYLDLSEQQKVKQIIKKLQKKKLTEYSEKEAKQLVKKIKKFQKNLYQKILNLTEDTSSDTNSPDNSEDQKNQEGQGKPDKCGDGVVQKELGEECDDGNKVSGDLCSANCKDECHDQKAVNYLKEGTCIYNCTYKDIKDIASITKCSEKAELIAVSIYEENCTDTGEIKRGCDYKCKDGYAWTGKRCGKICDDKNAENYGYPNKYSEQQTCYYKCDYQTSDGPHEKICALFSYTENQAYKYNKNCEQGNGFAPQDKCEYKCRSNAYWDGKECVATVCGDGKVEGNEECDDGNTDDGDGCDSLCRVEHPETPTPSTPTTPTPTDEICTDPRAVNTGSKNHHSKYHPCYYYCDFDTLDEENSRSCAIVSYQHKQAYVYNADCTSENDLVPQEKCEFKCRQDYHWNGTACVKDTCGDGTVQENEECDDGNTEDGDGCDQNCQLEQAATPTPTPLASVSPEESPTIEVTPTPRPLETPFVTPTPDNSDAETVTPQETAAPTPLNDI